MYPDDFVTESLAREQVVKYGTAFGQMPAFLRIGVRAMIIMKGDTFTGGLSTMDVRTDGNEEEDGLLVEVMVH